MPEESYIWGRVSTAWSMLRNGLASYRIFMEAEIYAQELERILARCLLFLCHESQVPQRNHRHSIELGAADGRPMGAGTDEREWRM